MADVAPFTEDVQSSLYTGEDRMCRRCKEIKTLSEEHWRLRTETREGKKHNYLRKICRKCEDQRRVEHRRMQVKHRSASLARPKINYERRKAADLRRYGITQEQYDILCESQSGLCAICNRPETRMHHSGRIQKLAVDHDHNSGRVRGLLCARCNAGIGLLMESSKILHKASEYLERHGA